MSTIAYKCPCCGSALAYGAESGKLDCASCGNSFDLDAMEALYAQEESGSVHFDMPSESYSADDQQQMQAYICKSCGAELITEGTTTATECPYCGSPTVLPDRIEGGVKPEKVIPFTVSKEQAQKQFQDYFKGKKLMPNIFLNSRNRIAEMRKLYVPYWLFDCEAQGNFTYNAEKRRTERRGDWEITHIRHYLVRRSGSMGFENIPVDGSEKLDNKITESLEPYDLSAAVPFQPAVLAGAMADHADVDASVCEGRAVERVETSFSEAVRATVTGYSSVIERGRNIHAEGGKVTPVLMPVWMITTEKENNTYTFAINGQTGKLTCDVPTDKGKAFGWGALAFAISFAVIALILMLLNMLNGTGLVIGGIISLIIALIYVSVLKGQLKQAAHQSAASNYIRQNSFNLSLRNDHFLYENVQKRKIEKPQPNK